MNNLIFSDRLLIFISAFALIITMGFVAMMLMDLNDIWDEIMSYKQRIENLETLIMLHNNVSSKVGCGV